MKKSIGHRQASKMKIYYRMQQNHEDDFSIQSSSVVMPKRGNIEPRNFYKGMPIPLPKNTVFELEIDCPKEQSPGHFINGPKIVVVSKYLLDCLRKAGVDNFQTWPAVLHEPTTGRRWNNYYTFNELGLLDAVLLKESKYDEIMEGSDDGSIPAFLGFHEIVFDATKTLGKKMFRIPQDPTELFLHEDVIEKLSSLAPPDLWGMELTEIAVK